MTPAPRTGFDPDELPPWETPLAAPVSNGRRRGGRHVVGQCIADVEARPVRWAWHNRVPLGSTTLLVGREGDGKGIVSAHLAARWSRGQLDGDLHGTPANVALITVEDSPSQVLKPRLMAAGADLERVFVMAVDANGQTAGVELPRDMPAVVGFWLAKDVRIVIVDVPQALMSRADDSNKDQDIRRAVMTPLGMAAEKHDLAVVILHHLNRAPSTAILNRIAASLGLSRAARAVLAIAPNPGTEDERVLVLAKANLGPLEVPALRFRIEGVDIETPAGTLKPGRAVLLGETDKVTRHNLLVSHDDEEERMTRDDAKSFLEQVLADGPVLVVDVKQQARRAGISARTLDRAKADLGVRSQRQGFGGEGVWRWALSTPPQPIGSHENMASNGESGALWPEADHASSPAVALVPEGQRP